MLPQIFQRNVHGDVYMLPLRAVIRADGDDLIRYAFYRRV
jgi:hypothetical protein